MRERKFSSARRRKKEGLKLLENSTTNEKCQLYDGSGRQDRRCEELVEDGYSDEEETRNWDIFFSCTYMWLSVCKLVRLYPFLGSRV